MRYQIKVTISRFVWLAFLTGVFVLAAPKSALAHARLVRSTPEADVAAAQTPAQIELWFNELLDNGFNSITVFSAADSDPHTRKNLATGDAKVDAKDRTHLTVALNQLPPGEYVVEWRVLSLDGHTAPGKFKFKVSTAK